MIIADRIQTRGEFSAIPAETEIKCDRVRNNGYPGNVYLYHGRGIHVMW